ncbi:dihydrolipoyl dehydrogenase [Halovivax gelatinilyticus]|uniref:dihydrolipoyl dehydrogenase n=1 Tax=Halovivax gelatinilyticus TaxID=2961597 RepID=UPI0020CA9C43|nr:dihydrolipoyl dehydrogenase [Halovivax gelatinilyticus]
MSDHDVLVLGGGSGSQVAVAAAQAGYDAAVVEPGPLGGACITRGCVPSKALISRADRCRTIRTASDYGIEASVDDVDVSGIVESVRDLVYAKADRQAETLDSMDGLTRYEARGRFVDDGEVELEGGERDGERIAGDQVVIAVGGRPVMPSIDGIDEGVRTSEDAGVLTSDDALFLDERPDRLAIVGGGYISVELSHYFEAIGTEVSIVGRSDLLVPREATAASEAVTDALGRRCDVYTGYEATEVRERGAERMLTAEATDGSGDDVTLRVDQVLVAAGRRPNTDDLGLESTAVSLDDDGHVSVDETLATDAAGVWALGDVLAEFPFKHVADREAEVVATNVLTALDDGDGRDDRPETIDRSALPHAIFTEPRVASVGATASELDDEDADYERERVSADVAPLGRIDAAPEAFVEVLADPADGTILGCHVVGPEAPTLIQEVVTTMTIGEGTVDEVVDTVHVHPARSEVILGAFDQLSERTVSTAPDWRDVDEA